MLNIISNEYFKSEKMVSGPIKVFKNLIKGLDIIGYPYVVNGDINACDKLWLYNDAMVLKKIKKINKDVKILLGPSFVSDRYISKKIKDILKEKSDQIVCLQPSEWSKEMLLDFGYNYTPVEAWPVGIDTEEFKPLLGKSKDFVLIYFKQRFEDEKEEIEKVLKKNNIKYKIIVYGDYLQKDFLNFLNNAKYIIWIGRQESQGIGFQEALSMNVPILVWDVKKVGHWLPPVKDVDIFLEDELEYKNTTVAPYFDDTCGVKFYDIGELGEKIAFMEGNYKNFSPREYILNNLSLEKQALEFLNIFDKYWGLKVKDGYKSKVNTDKKWKNEFLWKIFSKVYYFVRRLIK